VIYKVEFSLDAAAELLRIAEVVGISGIGVASSGSNSTPVGE